MMNSIQAAASGQVRRNKKLLDDAKYLGASITSKVLPLQIDVAYATELSQDQIDGIEALQVEAARTAIQSLASLSKIGELDHLGGGLELIPALTMTLAVTDYERVDFTIEHAHTSIGYFGALAAYGFVKSKDVVEGFRRGLDVPGHVSWLPGGTQLNGGRLGVMVPVAVGQALGKKARRDDGAWVVTHCGDAGWISGQALNGFNGADAGGAPVTFVMHRNGIQLSGSTKSVMDKDPRSIIESLGVRILEIPTLHDTAALYAAYREGWRLAQEGTPNLIYPTGYRSSPEQGVIDLNWFGEKYGIRSRVEELAGANGVSMDRPVWVPGSLMSYGDEGPMAECVFLVNDLPGGAGHHDGHMKGRDEAAVLAEPMLQLSPAQQSVLAGLRKAKPRKVVTDARPAKGSPNLQLSAAQLRAAKLPAAGDSTSPRSGSEAGYAAVAEAHADSVFIVSCDLDPSTKLGKAKALLAADHMLEMSIEEQAAALIADGLAMSSREPQLNVVSTFAAFYEGIAREGFDMWRYQRNLTGVNEGLNVTFHVSHVGSCTGRDHFSGWGLDWINIGLTYLPYLHRFHAPADARAAFLAVIDSAANYGGHVIGLPRDNLPVLAKQDGSGPLWEATHDWQTVTSYRQYDGAERAILALGAPAYVGGHAAEKLAKKGVPTDVHIINGLPLEPKQLDKLLAPYTGGVVTIEDGFIGTEFTGVRGFAALVASRAADAGLPVAHIGITDPTTAPAEGHMETWEHFGMTSAALVKAIQAL
jgi:transketolase N-terminal domain/subunit/transketolase C-terminal domain/subunit